ncbi:hypothetical protein BGX34_005320 [Mortierella sp. NVP85]|nr:hypothetical protein BGX34_005320 [Mortierella sp. NVP85]
MAVSPPVPANPPPAASNAAPKSSITLVFAQGGSTCLLRPNAVVRGHVELKLIKPCYAAGIRVKLKAEESAIVLGQESNGDSIRQKFRQTVITLFDTDIVVSGSDQNDNELSNWHEVPSGTHTYPFALKVPNVNFPPCIPGLDGFNIRYVWTAHVEGPFESSLTSEEVLCQFVPYVLAPKPVEWTYHDVIGAVATKNSTPQLNKQPTGIAIDIRMQQQIYVPGDPLSMATTLVNNGQNKIVGIDIVLRRTIKGTFSTSYANLCNQSQVEIMAKSVDCKVRPGETGQADILTTIPPMSGSSMPTFESNFLKVYYELLCSVRVKRSVFAGGDTSYQCAIPIPIATHNIDNPIITGRTPRWTKSRMQPYFFDASWPDPVGDLHAALVQESAPTVTPTIATGTSSPGDLSVGLPSSASASTTSLVSSPGTSSSAMHEFLNSGSAELHRERTLKKSLARSKSLKDIHSARLNGASWRAERDLLLSQSREMASAEGSGSNKRSPPLGPRARSSNDEKHGGAGSALVDSNGNVGYTPPPSSTSRPPKSANRDLTPEQQAEQARKASRRILPNQGQYSNDGTLPPEFAHTENQHSSSSNGNTNSGSSNSTSTASTPAHQPPSPGNSGSIKVPPRRNASLSHKVHPQSQSSSNGNYVAEPENMEPVPRRDASYERNGQYDSTSPSRGRSPQDMSGYFSSSNSPATPERVPYQHSLPAHQQPPGVVSPSSMTASPVQLPGSSPRLERSPSGRDALFAGDFLPPPPFNRPVPSGSIDDYGRHHKRSGSNSSTNNATASVSLTTRIPSWERVERIHHQDWFRPGPHQSGALQTFDVAGLALSHQQAVPIMKKSLQRPPMETLQNIEVEEQLR